MKLFAALALVASLGLVALATPDHGPQLFNESSMLELRLEAPVSRLFADAKAKPSGTVAVAGALSYSDAGRTVTIEPVRVSVRGNTSRRDTECTFPKLRVDFSHARIPAGSLFEGIDSLRVGTHCGDRPDGELTKLGRWANEKSPVREAIVYRLLDAVGVATLRARPARIAYVEQGRQPLVRGAMLLEDQHAAIARLGGAGELKTFTNARDDFSIDDAAALTFAEAMVGNFDWSVKFSPDDYYRTDHTHPLWNITAVRRADGTAFPLATDFDLAGTVTGTHPWFSRVYFDGFLSSRSHPAIEVLGQVQRTRTLFDRPVLDRTRQRFEHARPRLARIVDAAVVDEEGRRFAREYLDSFFDAIGSDAAFYRPVVVRSGALPYAGADGTAAACGAGDRIPVGTAVGKPLAQDGGRVRVPLLDVWWHWASRCDAVHTGPVWVDAGAIGDDFPPAAQSTRRR